MNTNNTATAPSAPLYVDLLSDDSFYWDAANRGSTTNATTTTTPIATVTTITPTARAIYTTTTPSTWIHEDDDRSRSHENQKIVVIPSSSVLLDSSYKPHNHVLATRPPSTATASSSSSSFVGRMEAMAIPQDPPPRYYKGKRVKTKNAHLPDAVLDFKAKRQQRTVLATCTGGAIGLVVLGPLGGVLGASSAYAVAKTVGKRRERKLTERALLQQQYQSSSAVMMNSRGSSTADDNALPSLSSGMPIRRAEAA